MPEDERMLPPGGHKRELHKLNPLVFWDTKAAVI